MLIDKSKFSRMSSPLTRGSCDVFAQVDRWRSGRLLIRQLISIKISGWRDDVDTFSLAAGQSRCISLPLFSPSHLQGRPRRCTVPLCTRPFDAENINANQKK